MPGTDAQDQKCQSAAAAAELVRRLKPAQLDDMLGDFMRVCGADHRLPAGRNPIAAVKGEGGRHAVVVRTLIKARIAEDGGDSERAQLLRGMAAAFYGVIRMAEAAELENSLGVRLGLSDPGSKVGSAETTVSRKEEPVLQTDKQFGFEDLVGFLSQDGVKFSAREEDKAVRARFRGDEYGPVDLCARVSEQAHALALTFQLPLMVPVHKRQEMAEATARANYGLVIGNFELDMRDGELNYKVAIPIDEAPLSHAQFRHCMGVGLAMIRRYMPAYFQIVYKDATPEDAINACEG